MSKIRVKKSYFSTGLVALLLIWAFMFSFPSQVSAQPKMSDSEKEGMVSLLADRYQDWETVTLSGKLRMHGLPVSPSLKAYMQKDSCIIISLRVPLMGEVGRLEVYPEYFVAVNKMKKTYVEEPFERLEEFYPGNLGDLQNIFLGYVVLPGFGVLDSEEFELIDIYPDSEGQYSLIPIGIAELSQASYGYLLNNDLSTAALLIIPVINPTINVMFAFNYYSKGYDITLDYVEGERGLSASLELDLPKWGGDAIEPIKLNKKYTQLSLDQFMKAF